MAITLRKFPYPYLGAMAICPDTDSVQLTRWRGNNFEDFHIFLNTKEPSLWGTGVGLDVGDSFFMYNQAKHLIDVGYTSPTFRPDNWTSLQNARCMAWYDGISTTPQDRDAILHYIRSGWIDSIHSYGDFSRAPNAEYLCTREMSLAACQDLVDNGIQFDVWINHGADSNRQNMFVNAGDNPASPYYHADVTIPNMGIRFLWFDRVTTGVDTLLVPMTLQDGQELWSFPRFYGPASDGVLNWQMKYFHEQVTPDRLAEIKRGKYMIIAQHFGAYQYVWPHEAIAAWRLLAAESEAGNILVARTSRLLRYNLAHDYVSWTYHAEADVIEVTEISDPQFGAFVPTVDDVRGLTWEGTTSATRVFIDGDEVFDITRPAPGITMVEWYKPDHTNYTGRDLMVQGHRWRRW